MNQTALALAERQAPESGEREKIGFKVHAFSQSTTGSYHIIAAIYFLLISLKGTAMKSYKITTVIE